MPPEQAAGAADEVDHSEPESTDARVATSDLSKPRVRAGRLTTKNVGSLQRRIEVSSDLGSWSPLADYVSADSTVQILDMDAANASHRFYRAVQP
jgi:hypothetical protein